MSALAFKSLDEFVVGVKASGVSLHGEIITWEVGSAEVPYEEIVKALESADLDAAMAKEMLPKNAFSRACRKLKEQRIIRPLDKDSKAKSIRFQFTEELRRDDHLEYNLEAIVTLDTLTGDVTCPNVTLATVARDALNHCIGVRTPSDVSRLVQRLFDDEAKKFPVLFPIRRRGGAYFVPLEHAEFIRKVQHFLRCLGGELNPFPVPAGTAAGDRSVKDAVGKGIASLIEEYETAVKEMSTETSLPKIERLAERITLAKHKIEAYSIYLDDKRESLNETLARVAGSLKSKKEELSKDAAWSEKWGEKMKEHEEAAAAAAAALPPRADAPSPRAESA